MDHNLERVMSYEHVVLRMHTVIHSIWKPASRKVARGLFVVVMAQDQGDIEMQNKIMPKSEVIHWE